MKVFLDANILVAILNKEYPLFPNVARLLSIQDNKKFQLCTSTICLAIAFYFACKKHGASLAKQKISLLAQHLQIADCGKNEAILAAENKSIEDYEDGLEYYAALNIGCRCIITEDKKDFYFSEIEVMNTLSFLKAYVV